MNFQGSRVWITGASSGIGEGLIAPLVERGARLAISARRGDALEAIAAGWRAKGADVRAFPLDVTDRAAVERTVAAIEQAFGGIDVAILSVNYFGVVYGIGAVLPGMLARGRGYIAGVASIAGYRAVPAAGAYGASKAAVIHMLDSIRFELEPRGIRVSV